MAKRLKKQLYASSGKTVVQDYVGLTMETSCLNQGTLSCKLSRKTLVDNCSHVKDCFYENSSVQC